MKRLILSLFACILFVGAFAQASFKGSDNYQQQTPWSEIARKNPDNLYVVSVGPTLRADLAYLGLSLGTNVEVQYTGTK